MILTFSIPHCTKVSFLSLVNNCGFIGCYWLAFCLCVSIVWFPSLALSVLVDAYVALVVVVVSLVGKHEISLSL